MSRLLENFFLGRINGPEVLPARLVIEHPSDLDPQIRQAFDEVKDMNIWDARSYLEKYNRNSESDLFVGAGGSHIWIHAKTHGAICSNLITREEEPVVPGFTVVRYAIIYYTD